MNKVGPNGFYFGFILRSKYLPRKYGHITITLAGVSVGRLHWSQSYPKMISDPLEGTLYIQKYLSVLCFLDKQRQHFYFQSNERTKIMDSPLVRIKSVQVNIMLN